MRTITRRAPGYYICSGVCSVTMLSSAEYVLTTLPILIRLQRQTIYVRPWRSLPGSTLGLFLMNGFTEAGTLFIEHHGSGKKLARAKRLRSNCFRPRMVTLFSHPFPYRLSRRTARNV